MLGSGPILPASAGGPDSWREWREKATEKDRARGLADLFWIGEEEGWRRCDLETVDGRGLSWKGFEAQGLARKPLHISYMMEHLFDKGPESWALRPFLEALQARENETISLGNGRNDGTRHWRKIRVADCFAKETSATGGTLYLVQKIVRRAWFEMYHKLLAQPSGHQHLLRLFSVRPLLTLGVLGSGESVHSHGKTWVGLLHGTKA